MPLDERSSTKYLTAVDFAGIVFEHEFADGADPYDFYAARPIDDLYEALEMQGYTWNGEGWYTEEVLDKLVTRNLRARGQRSPATQKRINRKQREAEQLRGWLSGEPLPGKARV